MKLTPAVPDYVLNTTLDWLTRRLETPRYSGRAIDIVLAPVRLSDKVSIIVPTRNEAGDIRELLFRIGQTLAGHAQYEVIVIDDHSEDGTYEIVSAIQQIDPRVRVYTKRGEPGKAYSLLEGFAHVRYGIVGIIDADLQYPPEALLPMLAEVKRGADVVVANRLFKDVGLLRRWFSHLGRRLYGKWLHGLDYDVQSGQKMFRRELLDQVSLSPTPWTFDLDFLIQARDAGSKITSVNVIFSDRTSGESKVSFLKTGFEIATNALKLKFRGPKVISTTDDGGTAGFYYKGQRYVTHSDLHHSESALRQLTRRQALVLVLMGAVSLSLLVLDWHLVVTVLIALLTVVYFADLLFNLYLIGKSLSEDIEIKAEAGAMAAARTWPTYTIFCPLYKEWEVLPQFVTAMSHMDYPKDKLQVMLLLEENDPETIQHARAMELPSYFEIVVVPDSKPKTKPKACNYGLKQATGEYIVIYDAEDVPEPNQLKHAVVAFEQLEPDVACVQAKLNFYNPRQNILTRAFTAEYSLWFDLVLTGLQSARVPIPLGGTSNHFKKQAIQRLNGWDAFNVTEDCDLGVRLAKRGYRTAMIESITLEEANSAPVNWFFQRTRWIKGYMQTYWVHMRRLRDFKMTLREPHALTFQLVVGGKVASMFINPFMWVMTISYFVLRPIVGPAIESVYPLPVLYMGVLCLIFGNFLYMYYYMLGCAKREQFDLIKYAFLIPIYWLAMSAAAWVAVVKLFYQPHQWFKTQHGLHLADNRSLSQLQATIGHDLVDDNLVHHVPGRVQGEGVGL
jgi:cellulose synthase/poly-beta-1,6-N-acetylglucosamine synthase-like glycosyltransferase